MSQSAFVISLDFELFWGVADIYPANAWKDNIKKVYDIIPRTLELFKKYEIRATWATVGGIMLEDEDELLHYLRKGMPRQTRLLIDSFKFDDESKAIPSYMLFGSKLVKLISQADGQEIGTHTFTHYYCDKSDSIPPDFRNEIKLSIEVAINKGFGTIQSIVFPRNQVSDPFLHALPNEIKIYRGKIEGFIEPLKRKHPLIGTMIWYLDHYFPLQKSYYNEVTIKKGERCNVRLSRLFKAYNRKYKFFEGQKLRRYKVEMESAAKRGCVYHLCWHPHNFSENIELNFAQLEEILKHYKYLHNRYGMRSMNMGDFSVML